MNKSELDHVWHSVTSVLENEFRTRGWLPPQAARIEVLEASLAEWKALAIQWAKDNDTLEAAELADWLANYATCFVREERDARKMLDIVQVLRS